MTTVAYIEQTITVRRAVDGNDARALVEAIEAVEVWSGSSWRGATDAGLVPHHPSGRSAPSIVRRRVKPGYASPVRKALIEMANAAVHPDGPDGDEPDAPPTPGATASAPGDAPPVRQVEPFDPVADMPEGLRRG